MYPPLAQAEAEPLTQPSQSLSFSLLLSLSLVSTNLSSGPFDKLGVGKDLLDKVIDDKKENIIITHYFF